MKTSDEMKKDISFITNDIFGNRGYRAALKEYLPKVEMLENLLSEIIKEACYDNHCDGCEDKPLCPIAKAKELL